MSHIYRLIIGPHKHVCNAIWANLDWFWRESNCLIVNRSFLCHLTYNLRYQENSRPLICLFWIYRFWSSLRVMGYGGNLEPTPCATLHIVATLQIFADLCRSMQIFASLQIWFSWSCTSSASIFQTFDGADANQIIWCKKSLLWWPSKNHFFI